MAGFSLTVSIDGFERLLKKLRPLFDFQPSELMSMIGALGEMQTRRRIIEEKTAPDGTAWPANSQGTPILMQTGEHLLASLAWRSSSDEAEWGSTWQFAHVHQNGAEIVPKNAKALAFSIGGNFVMAKKVTIPQRQFIGLSHDNENEIEDLVTDFFGLGN